MNLLRIGRPLLGIALAATIAVLSLSVGTTIGKRLEWAQANASTDLIVETIITCKSSEPWSYEKRVVHHLLTDGPHGLITTGDPPVATLQPCSRRA